MLSRRAAADTLEWALVQAYQNNPSLNAQRAALRATDENVPQALSGYRPKLAVTANAGDNYTSVVTHQYSNTGNVIPSTTSVKTPFATPLITRPSDFGANRPTAPATNQPVLVPEITPPK